jgi:hypothetical protein
MWLIRCPCGTSNCLIYTVSFCQVVHTCPIFPFDGEKRTKSVKKMVGHKLNHGVQNDLHQDLNNCSLSDILIGGF